MHRAPRDDAPELGERARPVPEVQRELRHRALEPGVLERQLLGDALLQPDACRHATARDLQHLRRRVDAPHLAALPLGERGGETPRAAADVEHAAAAEVTLGHEEREELPPVRVGGTELVVERGEAPEVRTARQ